MMPMLARHPAKDQHLQGQGLLESVKQLNDDL